MVGGGGFKKYFLCSIIYNLKNVNKGNNQNHPLVYIVTLSFLTCSVIVYLVIYCKSTCPHEKNVLCWFQLRDDVVPKTAGKKNLFLVL